MIKRAGNKNELLVWFVTGNLPPYFSGAGRNDLLLAPSCYNNGLNIILVTNRNTGDFNNDIINGVKVRRFKLGDDHNLIWKFIGPLNFVRHLLTDPRPGVIRFRGFSFRTGLIIFLIKLFFKKIKIIVQPAMYGGDDALSILNKKFGKFLLNQTFKSDLIFSMNNLISSSYTSVGFNKEKIKAVENPVDLNKFKPLNVVEKKKLRKSLKIDEEGFVFITSGIISKRKRQAFITEAFVKYMSNSHLNSYLLHMGPTASEVYNESKEIGFREKSKEEENKIEKIKRDSAYGEHILLVGYKEFPEEYLKIADVFVHASLYEGKANAVNEAFACGLPALVPNITLYNDYVPQAVERRRR